MFIQLPKFVLYGQSEQIIVHVELLQRIDLLPYQSDLENFSRYVFRHVVQSDLDFDLNRSSFKALLCFLNGKRFSFEISSSSDCFSERGEIDRQRMRHAVSRPDRSVLAPQSDELYQITYLCQSQKFVYESNPSLQRRMTDQNEKSQTYLAHFTDKCPELSLESNDVLVALFGHRAAQLNYHQRPTALGKSSQREVQQFPLKALRFAPLNRNDWQRAHRLPSLLLRVFQLCRVERFRKNLAERIACYSVRL
jgi:hypothetical protein